MGKPLLDILFKEIQLLFKHVFCPSRTALQEQEGAEHRPSPGGKEYDWALTDSFHDLEPMPSCMIRTATMMRKFSCNRMMICQPEDIGMQSGVARMVCLSQWMMQ
jgi:hypothetical protein